MCFIYFTCLFFFYLIEDFIFKQKLFSNSALFYFLYSQTPLFIGV